uniref:NADH dehydrogenase [ubiquinone] 1 beta subcomplex subunit 3 n=1 Tax=Parastrongyloides trichosuri TaxID=131310 RepID=A0A0N4ZV20_PARTI
MGGGHHEDLKIPHASAYSNYRQYPELANLEKRLSHLGLRDPWIRNYVYLYNNPNTAHARGQFQHFKLLMRSGFKPGVALAAAVIAIEEGYSYIKHGHTSWNSHH